MAGMVARIFRTCALFPLRAAVFAVGFADYWLEAAADWLVGARSSTEYVREGSCVRCGRCCSLLGVEMPAWVARRGWLVGLLRAWHSAGLNFEYQGQAETMLAYRCRYYRDGSPATQAEPGSSREARRAGGCSIYPFRHRLCRTFPRQRLYGRPPLHAECGFRFVRREVAARRRDLAKAGRADFSRVLAGKQGGGARSA